MNLRRKIAFLAVLISSLVLFAHAIVPHHHHASDSAFCAGTEHVETLSSTSCCAHSNHTIPEEEQISFTEHCGHCDLVGCTPTLPFTLNHNANFGSELLPEWFADFCLSLVIDCPTVLFAESFCERPEILLPGQELSNLPRRAPPVRI